MLGPPGAGQALQDPSKEPEGAWVIWTLTVFVHEVRQPCFHPALVNMSVQAQDVHLVVLWRRVVAHGHLLPELPSCPLSEPNGAQSPQRGLGTGPGGRDGCLLPKKGKEPEALLV